MFLLAAEPSCCMTTRGGKSRPDGVHFLRLFFSERPTLTILSICRPAKMLSTRWQKSGGAGPVSAGPVPGRQVPRSPGGVRERCSSGACVGFPPMGRPDARRGGQGGGSRRDPGGFGCCFTSFFLVCLWACRIAHHAASAAEVYRVPMIWRGGVSPRGFALLGWQDWIASLVLRSKRIAMLHTWNGVFLGWGFTKRCRPGVGSWYSIVAGTARGSPPKHLCRFSHMQ